MRLHLTWMILVLVFLTTMVEGKEPLQVCALVDGAKRYDGKKVVATGTVVADRHLTGIRGEGCSHIIVISYDNNVAPKQFIDGIEEKRLGLNPRPFAITIEGRFTRKVKGPLGYVSRIVVTKVVHYAYALEK